MELEKLTPREQQVLDHLIHGFTSREIAKKLKISRTTINAHRKHLYEKLDAHTSGQAVFKAISFGLIKVENNEL